MPQGDPSTRFLRRVRRSRNLEDMIAVLQEEIDHLTKLYDAHGPHDSGDPPIDYTVSRRLPRFLWASGTNTVSTDFLGSIESYETIITNDETPDTITTTDGDWEGDVYQVSSNKFFEIRTEAPPGVNLWWINVFLLDWTGDPSALTEARFGCGLRLDQYNDLELSQPWWFLPGSPPKLTGPKLPILDASGSPFMSAWNHGSTLKYAETSDFPIPHTPFYIQETGETALIQVIFGAVHLSDWRNF